MDYKAQMKEWKKRREKIASMLDRGTPAAVIAQQLGVSRQRIYQLARSAK